MQQQAENLTAAVKATDLYLGVIYRLWPEDSTWTHATGFLAGRYAPAESDDTMGMGKPPSIYQDLEVHPLTTMAIVVSASHILAEEGVASALAGARLTAFYEVR